MVARKISVSMDENLIDEVQHAAEEAGMTVSAWLAETAQRGVALAGWSRLIADFEAEHGAFTEAEKAEARAQYEAAGFRRPHSGGEDRRAS